MQQGIEEYQFKLNLKKTSVNFNLDNIDLDSSMYIVRYLYINYSSLLFPRRVSVFRCDHGIVLITYANPDLVNGLKYKKVVPAVTSGL